MRTAGVRAVVDAKSLAVVGLVEVIKHIPRIHGEFRKMVAAVKAEKPRLAILTDSPDFHLRLARKLTGFGIPVVYLIAPQVWAWRKGRVRGMRRDIRRLLCIFPFEEEFFHRHNVNATYIGHPLTRVVKSALTAEEFFRKHRLPAGRPMVVMLPGSRTGEALRHLPVLVEAAELLHRKKATTFVLALPEGAETEKFREPIRRAPIHIVEGETWDAIAHANLALAASGTVTVEAALLGTPMVTFYRVTRLSWWLGRHLVDVPHLSMVNLVAGRRIVPELIQHDMTAESIRREADRLLDDERALEGMKTDLAEVAARLSGTEDPIEKAASVVQELLV